MKRYKFKISNNKDKKLEILYKEKENLFKASQELDSNYSRLVALPVFISTLLISLVIAFNKVSN